MDGMFIWIVVFAGAAIALLAVFLVASEKELKKKRLEIDELLVKLGDAPPAAGISGPAELAPGFDSQELEQLRSRNQQLERQLAETSSTLHSGENISEELELAQRNVDIAKSNAQWLQSNNDELKAQIADLESRLAASESRAGDSAGAFGAANRQQVLEREVIELREQLAEGHAASGDVDAMGRRLADVDAIESSYRQEKSRLEAKIAELENELSSISGAKADETASVREQLAESERIQQLMRDERRGMEQEVARLQARVKEAEEQSRRIAALQEPFGKLLAKHSALEERQREYHEAMAGFSQLIATSSDRSAQTAGFNEFQATTPAGETRHAPISNGIYETEGAAVTPAQIIAAAETAQKPKRRFGLFPLVIALALGGTMVALWSLQSSDPTTTASALPVVNQEKAPPPPTPPAALPEPAESEAPATPQTPPVKEIAAPAAKEKAQPAKPIEVAKVQPPVTGTYEIIQSSRVFAAPSELSQQMGDIEPGVRVNVVNAKNGWLEIHSKHGRPPGFIRKESARVLAQN